MRSVVPIVVLACSLAGCTIETRDDTHAEPARSAERSRPSLAPMFFVVHRVSETPAPGFHALEMNGGEIQVSDEPVISNRDIASARAVDDGSGSAKIDLVWTPEGRRRFAAATREYQGQTLVLVIDGHPETMLAFDAPVDEATTRIGKGDATTMQAAAAFAARFGGR